MIMKLDPAETAQSFAHISTMHAKAQAFHAALQKLMAPKLSPEKAAAFQADSKKWEDRYLRVQIKRAEIVNPELAPKLRALRKVNPNRLTK
jgi:hypothetical protein